MFYLWSIFFRYILEWFKENTKKKVLYLAHLLESWIYSNINYIFFYIYNLYEFVIGNNINYSTICSLQYICFYKNGTIYFFMKLYITDSVIFTILELCLQSNDPSQYTADMKPSRFSHLQSYKF